MMQSLRTCLLLACLTSKLQLVQAERSNMINNIGSNAAPDMQERRMDSDPQQQPQQQQPRRLRALQQDNQIFIGAPGTYLDFSKPKETPPPIVVAPAPAPLDNENSSNNNTTITTATGTPPPMQLLDNTDDFIPPPQQAAAAPEGEEEEEVIPNSAPAPAPTQKTTTGIAVGYVDSTGHAHANPGMELPARFVGGGEETRHDQNVDETGSTKSSNIIELQAWHRLLLAVFCVALLVSCFNVYRRCNSPSTTTTILADLKVSVNSLKLRKRHGVDDNDDAANESGATDQLSESEASNRPSYIETYHYGDKGHDYDLDEDWNGPLPRRRGTTAGKPVVIV